MAPGKHASALRMPQCFGTNNDGSRCQNKHCSYSKTGRADDALDRCHVHKDQEEDHDPERAAEMVRQRQSQPPKTRRTNKAGPSSSSLPSPDKARHSHSSRHDREVASASDSDSVPVPEAIDLEYANEPHVLMAHAASVAAAQDFLSLPTQARSNILGAQLVEQNHAVTHDLLRLAEALARLRAKESFGSASGAKARDRAACCACGHPDAVALTSKAFELAVLAHGAMHAMCEELERRAAEGRSAWTAIATRLDDMGALREEVELLKRELECQQTRLGHQADDFSRIRAETAKAATAVGGDDVVADLKASITADLAATFVEDLKASAVADLKATLAEDLRVTLANDLKATLAEDLEATLAPSLHESINTLLSSHLSNYSNYIASSVQDQVDTLWRGKNTIRPLRNDIKNLGKKMERVEHVMQELHTRKEETPTCSDDGRANGIEASDGNIHTTKQDTMDAFQTQLRNSEARASKLELELGDLKKTVVEQKKHQQQQDRNRLPQSGDSEAYRVDLGDVSKWYADPGHHSEMHIPKIPPLPLPPTVRSRRPISPSTALPLPNKSQHLRTNNPFRSISRKSVDKVLVSL